MNPDSPRADGPLQRLAEALGIHRDYTAASGEHRAVPEASLRALCGAMGFPAEDDAQADQALASLVQNPSALDAVLLATEGTGLDAAWRGPVAGALAWEIELEDGARRAGSIEPVRDVGHDAEGTSAATIRLPLDGVPAGYHRLSLSTGSVTAACTLIVVPPRAYTPPAWATGQRDWAITAQLYALRSTRNWGIGDCSDLSDLGVRAAAHGASAVGLNPLHALYAANPTHLSPYSPSTRAFLNPVYLDVTAVPEFEGCRAAQERIAAADFAQALQAARASELVDYETVWRLKLEVLQLLHADFLEARGREPSADRARAFDSFCAEGGAPLHAFAVFEALQHHFVEQGLGASWRGWPEAYRDPASAAVKDWAAAHADDVGFALYLQWEVDRQLGAAAQAMREAGMDTGLYRDVAVGVDPGGAEAWSDQQLLVVGASVGAPPDLYNPKGQDWGLTPFNPIALKERAYAPFIAAVRANMRHAGAVRIDHVIGLKRLYWVPAGMSADAGGYVAYPYEALMGIVALESQRHQCLVVGEDLGTVPEGFREDAEARGMLSYRVLMFEREQGDGPFLAPAEYPELAAAAVSTHDLPTLAGLWTGRDLEWRRELEMYPDPHDADAEVAFRQSTRTALVEALTQRAGLSADAADALCNAPAEAPSDHTALIEAAYRYLAAAPSRLLLVQIEDLAAETEQMNLPGTVDQHPNWRRKLRCATEAIFEDADVLRTLAAIEEARQSR